MMCVVSMVTLVCDSCVSSEPALPEQDGSGVKDVAAVHAVTR